MNTTLTPQTFEEGTADADIASIRTTAIRIMEAHEKLRAHGSRPEKN